MIDNVSHPDPTPAHAPAVQICGQPRRRGGQPCQMQVRPGRPCPHHPPPTGGTAAPEHIPKKGGRGFKLPRALITVAAAVVALVTAFLTLVASIGGLAETLQFFGVEPDRIPVVRRWFDPPAATPAPLSAKAVTDDVIAFANSLAPTPPPISPTVTAVHRKLEAIGARERTCQQDKRQACWLQLSLMYADSFEYTQALNAVQLALNADPSTRDPHYARGELLYNLSVLDLIKRRRFELDEDKLRFTVLPDERSRIMFQQALDAYTSGDGLPALQDTTSPDMILLTNLPVIEFHKRQLKAFAESLTPFDVHRVDLFKVLQWLETIHPGDDALKNDTLVLKVNLDNRLKSHPGEFPGIPPPRR
jgi:hypothetical protein